MDFEIREPETNAVFKLEVLNLRVQGVEITPEQFLEDLRDEWMNDGEFGWTDKGITKETLCGQEYTSLLLVENEDNIPMQTLVSGRLPAGADLLCGRQRRHTRSQGAFSAINCFVKNHKNEKIGIDLRNRCAYDSKH